MDLIPYTLTFIGCIVLGVQYGTIIGVAVDLLILIYPVARPNIEFIKPSLLAEDTDLSEKVGLLPKLSLLNQPPRYSGLEPS